LYRDSKNSDLGNLTANTIRMLAVDAIQRANSGHPGVVMGMADCAYVLWTRFLKFNPEDPQWHNRDRFVLSAGHGSMLLYALLHLSEYDVSIDDIKQFRQWKSRTPGHPEYGCVPGVETTTGPLGQGFANGVGMALAAKIIGSKFNTEDFNIIDHYIYGIVSDGDLMEGISAEAASIAGHLGLGNIIYIYDDNSVTIEGSTSITFSENVKDRFDSYGWHTVRIDGHCHEEIESAISQAIEERQRPTLILARTHLGFGSPNKQDDPSCHGAPLGEEEVALTKKNIGWPLDREFFVPNEVRRLFKERVSELKGVYKEWKERFDKWKKQNPDLFSVWQKMINKDIPERIDDLFLQSVKDQPAATRVTSGEILQKAAEVVPSLYGGSADLAPSNKSYIKNGGSICSNDFTGRNIHFGIREHGMAGVLNGMALYGGIIPYGATFLVFSDYMRPSIRLAAMMGLQVIYIFSHDSIFVGEDGPTHQPVEQITSLRVIPNLTLIRPADGVETAAAWSMALNNRKGPTALCLTRQKVMPLKRPEGFKIENVNRGGYIIKHEDGEPDLILIASGSEVSICIEAAEILNGSKMRVRVVSMPSLDIFKNESESYRKSVIPEDDIPVVIVEAGVLAGWEDIVRKPLLFIGLKDFGSSAPYNVLAEKFGFTGRAVAEMVSCWIKDTA